MSRFSLTLLRRTQAKGNICQFQEPVASRWWLNPAKLPIALAHGLFEAEGRSNPQLLVAISVSVVLRLLARFGYFWHFETHCHHDCKCQS